LSQGAKNKNKIPRSVTWAYSLSSVKLIKSTVGTDKLINLLADITFFIAELIYNNGSISDAM
jgi:hypothetical protein